MKLLIPYRRLIAATAFAVVGSSSLLAQSVVGPATFQIYILNPDYLFYAAPGTYSGPYGSTRVSTNPVTLISARSFATLDRRVVSNNAYINYFFMMQGAPGRVSATFTADMFASLSELPVDENTLSRTYFTLSSAGTGKFYDPIGNVVAAGPSKDIGRSGPGISQFNKPVEFTVDANAMYMVALFAGAQTGSPNVVAEAFIDPVITISAAQQSSYALLLSPGISNQFPAGTTTVPEPASLVLVAGGLVGIAVGVRRRRAKR